MKILLLGGTGAMGSHLASILAETGKQVFVTTRQKRASAENITYIVGDAKSAAFLDEVLIDHWDAIVDFMVYQPIEFQQRLSKLLKSTSQYVFLSSARVYAESQTPITEDSPRLLNVTDDQDYLATNEYALSKARQEDALTNRTEKNWTIIRPYITYSETRLQLGTLEKEEWLYRAIKSRTVVFSEAVRHRLTTLTYGYDVALVMAKLLGHPKALGEAFHITSSNAYSWDSILEIYLKALEENLGKRPKIVYQDLEDFLKWNQRKHQVIYDRFYDRSFDNTKIQALIDNTDFVDAKSGLQKCVMEFLKKNLNSMRLIGEVKP